MSGIAQLDRWLATPAPPARLGMFRVLVGAYAAVWSAVRLPEHLALANHTDARWEPVGLLAPLASPPPEGAIAALALAVPALAVAFALGWRFRVIGPLAAVALLVLLTLASSWGQIFHTENLLAIHVVVLAAAPSAAALSLDARRSGGGPEAGSLRYGWPLRLAALATVATYMLAGWAKLRISGVEWIEGDVLLRLVAHDNLRKEVLGDTTSPVGAAAVQHAWMFSPMAVATLLVELGAPLALVGRRLRLIWAAGAWLFHVGVLALMAVLFPYHLVGLAFAPLFPLERLSRLRRGGRADPPPAVARHQPQRSQDG